MELVETDLKLLKELRQDGRQSYRQLAKKLHLAPGTVQSKTEKMVKEGIIKGFRASLNYDKLGFTITAIVCLTIKKDIDKFLETIKKHKNVFNVYAVTGEFDFIVTTRFRDMTELNNFLRSEISTGHIAKSTTFIVLDIIKEEFTLMD